ncbi:MAG TPA: hypothetical protein VN681_03480 [Stellaceae bacterium]|nr:hypothetical protein [Stellaceae bacterium]
MNSKLSFLARATAIAGIVALSLPALAQTNPPAAASTQAAPVAKSGSMAAKSDSKAKKDKTHAAKKHAGMMKTAKSDAGHKPAPVKTEAPASNAGK